MSLYTWSLFYFGFVITNDNNQLDFDFGSGELTAEINIGSYSFTELAVQIETAMNAVSLATITVTANRATRSYTISASNPVTGDPVNFELLPVSGSHVANSVFSLIGFSADTTGSSTYTGTAAGSAFTPQCILQDYVSTEDWQSAALASVNRSASGRVEVVKFGDEKFMQCNFKWINNYAQPSGSFCRNNATGIEDFREFVRFLITKAPIEFMPNENDTSKFEKLILESTPDSQQGIGYKLKELYDQGLPGWYESGVYTFRVVE